MKIKYVFTALLAGATLMSCNDYLDVESESQYNDKVVFSNTPLAENTVISIYSWFAATNSHRARYMPYYGMNTDAECYFDMAQPSSDNKTSPGNSRRRSFWMAFSMSAFELMALT
jgi:starch-binding outer membrane protein, SusD/RagB family